MTPHEQQALQARVRELDRAQEAQDWAGRFLLVVVLLGGLVILLGPALGWW